MKPKIYCRTVAKGRQAFYVNVNGKDYFLFEQDYRVSNKEFFRHGVTVQGISNYSNVHSAAVKKTMDKLPSYLYYIEKESGLCIYQKTKNKLQSCKKKAYKRTNFRWQDYNWVEAQ